MIQQTLDKFIYFITEEKYLKFFDKLKRIRQQNANFKNSRKQIGKSE